jgi:hypothetical protein
MPTYGSGWNYYQDMTWTSAATNVTYPNVIWSDSPRPTPVPPATDREWLDEQINEVCALAP